MSDQPSVEPYQLPGSLPADCIPEGSDLTGSTTFLHDVLNCPSRHHFTSDALWRDWMVFSDRVRTRAGSDVIAGLWTLYTTDAKPHGFQLDPPQRINVCPGSSWVEISFKFQVFHLGIPAYCSGKAGLVLDGQSWKVWELITMLEGLEGEQNPDVYNEAKFFKGTLSAGGHSEPSPALTNGHDPKAQVVEHLETIIVGGGQAGICLAAHISALNIPNLIIEKEDSVGSSWARRYDSFKFHTSKPMNSLPFDKTFPEEEPKYMTGKSTSAWFMKYAERYQLNVRLATTVNSTRYDEKELLWHVTTTSVEQGQRHYTARHLVLCNGHFDAKPKLPDVPGMSAFRGKLMHSGQWKNANGLEGKNAVVIGAGTSACDICEDMVEAKLPSVTMVQRGKIAIIPLQCTGQELFEMGIPMGVLDRMTARPFRHSVPMVDSNPRDWTRANPQQVDALEERGFKCDRDVFFLERIATTGGGYYIDVGACQRIIDGEFSVKSDSAIARFTENGVLFADGTELKADIVVCATGYDNDKRPAAEKIVGPEIASRLGSWWGLDAEGEQRGLMYQEYPGLWRFGGSLHLARLQSRYIALRIQVEMLTRARLQAQKA